MPSHRVSPRYTTLNKPASAQYDLLDGYFAALDRTSNASHSSPSSDSSFEDFHPGPYSSSSRSSSGLTSPDLLQATYSGILAWPTGPVNYWPLSADLSVYSSMGYDYQSGFGGAGSNNPPLGFSDAKSLPPSKGHAVSTQGQSSASPAPSASFTSRSDRQGRSTSSMARKPKRPVEPPTNPNEHLLKMPTYGPVSLPPQPYSGPSPFAPTPAPPPKVFGSQLDLLPPIDQRIGKLEKGVDDLLEQRGRQAVRNSTLPGLEPVRPTTTVPPGFPSNYDYELLASTSQLPSPRADRQQPYLPAAYYHPPNPSQSRFKR